MSIFDQPIDVLIRPLSPGVTFSCTQFFHPSGRTVDVVISEDAARKCFGWRIDITDPIDRDRNGQRCTWGPKSMDEYQDETAATVGACQELLRLGYDRLAHGILAEEWETARGDE